jgi:hypothetical protein
LDLHVLCHAACSRAVPTVAMWEQRVPDKQITLFCAIRHRPQTCSPGLRQIQILRVASVPWLPVRQPRGKPWLFKQPVEPREVLGTRHLAPWYLLGATQPAHRHASAPGRSTAPEGGPSAAAAPLPRLDVRSQSAPSNYTARSSSRAAASPRSRQRPRTPAVKTGHPTATGSGT